MVYTALPMGEVPCNLFPFAQDSGYKNVCPQIIHNTETKHIKIYIAQNHCLLLKSSLQSYPDTLIIEKQLF